VSGRDAVGNRRSALPIISAFSSRHLLSPQVAGSAAPTWLSADASVRQARRRDLSIYSLTTRRPFDDALDSDIWNRAHSFWISTIE
jgi:hypothetical protein